MKQRSDGGGVLVLENGFTVVELLIVIVIIGILVGLVITTFSGIQKKARNQERNNDIRVLHQQLEATFGLDGKYPTLDEINDSTWRTTNFKSVDAAAYKDPTGSSSSLAASPTANQYSYQPLNDADGPCDNTSGNDCTKYTLTGTLEGGGTTVKQSL